MIFESKYRRQAMQLWEEQKEETRKELLEDLKLHHKKITFFKSRIRTYFSMWFNPNKKSPQ